MKKYIFTDLACENTEYNQEYRAKKSEELMHGVTVQRVVYKLKESTCFFTNNITYLSDDEFFYLTALIAEEIKKFFYKQKPLTKTNKSFIVVGIGNPDISSDSLGPKTVRSVSVKSNENEISVFSVIPDIFANTGLSTCEVIKSYVKYFKPDIVLAVDSLCAMDIKRLCSTVQISEDGISPGSGYGRKVERIDSETIGVPVIAIGIPMAVNSATLAVELLKKMGISKLGADITDTLEKRRGYLVTPANIELTVRQASFLIAKSIDLAIQTL